MGEAFSLSEVISSPFLGGSPLKLQLVATCHYNPLACYRSLSGPKCPGSVPRGVSGALRAPGSGVSKKCPESVPGVSGTPFRHSGDTLGTLSGHSGARGPKGPRDTPRDTLGTLRARRARETPVAGRGGGYSDRVLLLFLFSNWPSPGGKFRAWSVSPQGP